MGKIFCSINQLKNKLALCAVLAFSLLLIGCTADRPDMDSTESPVEPIETLVVEGAPILGVSEEVVSEPVEPDKTLIICVAEDPGELFLPIYWNTEKEVIYQAIYDGGYFGYDLIDFSYEPVVLEKLPSLADGDAFIQTVTVNEGDFIMMDGFTLTELKPPHVKQAENGDNAKNAEGKEIVVKFGMPDWIRPSGCDSADCAVPYVGNPVFIDQPGVKYKPVGCRDQNCLKDYLGGPVEMEQMVAYFSFRPDLMWSDGNKVTADDSVYSYELNKRAAEKEQQNQHQFERVESYTSIDDYTVELRTSPGYLGSTYSVMFWVPLPAHAWSEYTYNQLVMGAYLENLIGYGPYKFEEYTPGKNLILSRNPYYLNSAETAPYFDTVVYRFVGLDASINSAGLISGECDILDTTTLVEDRAEFLIALAETGLINAVFVTSTVWEHLDFGIAHSDYDDGFSLEDDRPNLFGDSRTRQGIAYCINRQNIIDTLLFGQSKLLHSYIPTNHPAYNSDIRQYPFDIVKGATLLADAGWIYGSDGFRYAYGVEGVPDGTRLEMDLFTTVAILRQKVTDLIKADLAKCGVDVNVALMSPTELFAGEESSVMFGRNFDLVEFAWWTDVEPPCDLFISGVVPNPENNWEGFNVSGYSNPAFDLACTTAISSLPGEKEYLENHHLAQKIFAEDLPALPLFQRIKMAAARVDLCGFILDPSGLTSTWNIENFYLGDRCK